VTRGSLGALRAVLAGGLVVFAALGKDPREGFRVFFAYPLKDTYAIAELLLKATPLMLIAVGLAYLAWGLHRATRSDLAAHAHDHSHVVSQQEHADAWTHGHASAAGVWTPGMLFLIFVFGPSEPLVPLLMVPAARCGPGAVAAVVATFALATVVTMTLSVMLIRYGVAFVPQLRLGRYDHAVAGLVLLACGALVKFGL
jgi:hypothetical protein